MKLIRHIANIIDESAIVNDIRQQCKDFVIKCIDECKNDFTIESFENKQLIYNKLTTFILRFNIDKEYLHEIALDVCFNDKDIINLIDTNTPSFESIVGVSSESFIKKLTEEIKNYMESNKPWTYIKITATGNKNDLYPIFQYLKQHPDEILCFFGNREPLTRDVLAKKVHLDYEQCLDEVFSLNDFNEIVDEANNYVEQQQSHINENNAKTLLKNNDEIGAVIAVDFHPHSTQMRTAAIVIVREYSKGRIINTHVLIGDPGFHHKHIVKDPQYKFIFDNCKNRNGKSIMTFAYLLGNIAFLNRQEYNGFRSIKEVANILNQDHRIQKVYLDNTYKNGTIKRLAKLI